MSNDFSYPIKPIYAEQDAKGKSISLIGGYILYFDKMDNFGDIIARDSIVFKSDVLSIPVLINNVFSKACGKIIRFAIDETGVFVLIETNLKDVKKIKGLSFGFNMAENSSGFIMDNAKIKIVNVSIDL